MEGSSGFHLQLYVQELLLALLSDLWVVPGISFCSVSRCRGSTEVQLRFAHLNLIPQVWSVSSVISLHWNTLKSYICRKDTILLFETEWAIQ